MKIKLLDLCCKAGGAAMGYFKAALELGLDIEIIGVDIEEQPNYPFKFIKADAVEFLKKNWKRFTHIHASPPCQKYSCSTAQYRNQGKEYRDILKELTELMYKLCIPGVIENVQTAPIRPDVVLRGDMFGLKVLRVRHFENVNWFMMNPMKPKKIGSVREGDYCCIIGKGSWTASRNDKKPKFAEGTIRETWSKAMGIDWYMKDVEISEAIPPAYTKYIGKEFFRL